MSKTYCHTDCDGKRMLGCVTGHVHYLFLKHLHYLFMSPIKGERGWGGGHIGFSADPGRRRNSLYPPYHHIFWISGWNFTILSWIHHWDKPKGWLGFGDLDPIFKVTGGLRLFILLRWRRRQRHIFLFARYLLNPYLELHQNCMDILLRQALELTLF